MKIDRSLQVALIGAAATLGAVVLNIALTGKSNVSVTNHPLEDRSNYSISPPSSKRQLLLKDDYLKTDDPGSLDGSLNHHINIRMRDYASKLNGDYVELLDAWKKTFASNRTTSIERASCRVVSEANRLRKVLRIDATQLKTNTEFRNFISKEIGGILASSELRSELRAWAEGVEAQTRLRLVRCFQQVIAEDLGRSFDENLRGIVVKAVTDIPVEQLIYDAYSVAKIEAAILSRMPESAISENSRKWFKRAAVRSTQAVALVIAEGTGYEQYRAFISEAIDALVDPAVEGLLQAINEGLTAQPDVKVIENSITTAILIWNDDNLQLRLEAILSDYLDKNIKFLERKALEMGEDETPIDKK